MPIYRPIEPAQLPAGLHWNTPRHHQGQIVEYEYGDHVAGPHDEGAPYLRVTDHSLSGNNPSRVTLYRLSGSRTPVPK